jgi:hypothetical protein
MRRHILPVAIPVALAALALAVGCRPRSVSPGTGQPCAAITDSLPLTATSVGMAGRYRLVVVATAGPFAGSVASGLLELWRPDTSSHFQYAAPGVIDVDRAIELFHGLADVPLERVGALQDGDPRSRDPFHPGVLVKEFYTEGRSSATGPGGRVKHIRLTIGSAANRRAVISLDSLPPELETRRLDAVGFAGTWQSSRAGVPTGGHFCAFRGTG